MSRVSFYTLGCKLNYAESSTIERDFNEKAYDTVPFGMPADVVVINTCSVTAEAERKCRNIIRRARKASPDAFIIVTGCYAQLRAEEIAGLDGVDAVLGSNEKHQLFKYLDSFSKREKTQIAVSCIDDITVFGPAFSSGDRSRAFLKVQDGCDYTCSFCTIPLARGLSRSQSVHNTLSQARKIAESGYKEIVLSGINIGLYGQDHDDGTSFLDLIRALDDVEGICRFRISSIEPNLLTDEIIHFVAGSEKFQPHFHIPLQSGDDYVLGKMHRRYRRALFAERVDTVKKVMPHACIGVDVIVGFPVEDETRFRNTHSFLQDVPASYLHVFTYSERPGTTAVVEAEHIGGARIPKKERSGRNRVLRLLGQKMMHVFYTAHIGTNRNVLWEGTKKVGNMFGFTDNYIRVECPYDAARIGMIEKVQLGTIGDAGMVTVDTGDDDVLKVAKSPNLNNLPGFILKKIT